MNKNKYIITIDGCDDYTSFEMELDESELELIKRLSEKSIETSTYVCMPKLRIENSDNNEKISRSVR